MDTFLSRASTVSQSHKHPEVILHLHERLTWVRVQQGTDSLGPMNLRYSSNCPTAARTAWTGLNLPHLGGDVANERG
jgi:hypothetical protein